MSVLISVRMVNQLSDNDWFCLFPILTILRATESARRRLYQIMGAVWPVAGLGPVPTYAEVMAGVPNSAVTANIDACYANENGDPNNIYVKELAQMEAMSAFPNKIWSLVHLLVHNQPSPLTRERVQGFQAIAAFLLENFWCDDCRGFFYGGIVARYGMPPDTMGKCSGSLNCCPYVHICI